MFECIIIIEILWFEMLSVDLSLPESEAPFSQKKLRRERRRGLARQRSPASAPLFYKRLHQRPPSLYFRVWAGPEMIIPDMNSSTAISKLILLSLLLVARLARAFLWLFQRQFLFSFTSTVAPFFFRVRRKKRKCFFYFTQSV